MPLRSRHFVSTSDGEISASSGSSASLPQGAGPASSSELEVYTYDYFPPAEDWQPCPMVPIGLKGPADPLVVYGLADSGADSTALPLAEAPVLGIDLEEDCRKATGGSANGPGDQYIYKGTLEAQVEDIQFRITATFMDTPVILLGQVDFFRRFHVTFDYRAQQISLRPYPVDAVVLAP